MATYKVKAPDGQTITLNGPDGASDSDVMAQAQRLYKPMPATEWNNEAQMDLPVSSGANPLKAMTVGPAEAALHVGSSMVAAPVAGLAGIGSMLAGSSTPGDTVRNVQNAMTYRPRTVEGQLFSKAAEAPFQAYSDLVHAGGQAARNLTGSDLVGTTFDVLGDAAPVVAGGLLARGAAADIKPQPRILSPAEQQLLAGREAGFVVNPAESGGFVNRKMAGMAGNMELNTGASLKNAANIDRLAREDFALPADAPLTPDTFADIRKTAGQAYGEAKKLPQPLSDLSPLQEAVAKFMDPASEVRTAFGDEALNPEALKVVQTVKTAIDKGEISPSAAVEYWKKLGSDANESYKKGDTSLGAVQRQMADALSETIERNAAEMGQADVVANLRAARRTIAKSYAYQDALSSTGEGISGQRLAASLNRQERKGSSPMSGNMRMIAEQARQFPNSMKNVAGLNKTGISGLEAIGSIGGGIAGHFAFPGIGGTVGGAALPFLRNGVRSVMLSEPWQQMMRPGLSTNPMAQQLLTPEAAQLASTGLLSGQ